MFYEVSLNGEDYIFESPTLEDVKRQVREDFLSRNIIIMPDDVLEFDKIKVTLAGEYETIDVFKKTVKDFLGLK